MVQPATLRPDDFSMPRATPTGSGALESEPALSLWRSTGPQVDIAIPVYNEEADLEASVRRLHAYLRDELPFSFRITVVDNASTDCTWPIARSLEEELPDVVALHLEEKGRGRALRHVWTSSDAAVLAYMDVDLSTALSAVLPLVAPLVSGHSDMAIGTRLAHGSRVVRGTKREVISRCYNLLLRATLAAGFSDAQCGFKAIRADRARALLPLVKDTGWFFDTELLFLAERAGMRIHEVPVDWVDDADSRVDLLATALDDLRGIARLLRGLATGSLPLATLRASTAAEQAVDARPGLFAQLARFSAVGVVSTAAYVVLYVVLRAGLPALLANALALLVTALANTAVNRRVTFGVRSRDRHLRHQLQGIVVFAVGLALTTGALVVLHALAPGAGRGLEVAVLVTAGVLATAVRFALFRSWVFPSATPPSPTQPSPVQPSPMPRSPR
ncbi:MAG TPA: glycosyltransferase [Acidimicrobiales bacterium]